MDSDIDRHIQDIDLEEVLSKDEERIVKTDISYLIRESDKSYLSGNSLSFEQRDDEPFRNSHSEGHSEIQAEDQDNAQVYSMDRFYAERIAREEATREVESKLSNIDHIQEDTILPAYIESKVESMLSDGARLNDNYVLKGFIQELAKNRTRESLSDSEFITNQSAIPQVLTDTYAINESTIKGINRNISSMSDFNSDLVDYQRNRLETREQWQKIESVVAVLSGFGIIFFTTGLYDMITNLLPWVVGATIVVLLSLIGIGLLIAGFLGTQTTEAER